MTGFTSLLAAFAGFIITAVFGFVLIPFLRRIHFGQTILEIGPKWHKSKEGTPIMGGFLFITGTLLAFVIAVACAGALPGGKDVLRDLSLRTRLTSIIAGVVMALCMAGIGFMDDYIKAVKKQNLGLRAWQKTFLQLIVAGGYLTTLWLNGMTYTVIPFLGRIDISSGFGLLFWPIALIFIYGFTNAVNLTDGVDGLATTVTFVVSLFYMVAAGSLSMLGLQVLASALCGSLIGFLVWNIHPAKVFMGDTGSMFLGGMVVALAFAIDRPILLFLSGILYLGEAMSVVIQVTYYKKTKKRLFKMSPIHHHFEMSGWSENKIVIVFSAVAMAGCLLAMLLVYLG